MDNIDIFITAFKPFKEYVTNKIYKVVGVKDFKYEGTLESFNDNVGINISNMNHFFNELSVFYWVWKNYPMKEYIGMCSYRRYFNFLDDFTNVEKHIDKYEIILPTILSLKDKTNIEQYNKCHNIDDLNLILDIIVELYPEYKDDVVSFSECNTLYTNNMFIMKKEDFIKYCEFLFNVLNEYLRIMKFDNIEHIFEYVEKHKLLFENKTNKISKDLNYQARIGGFLGERIFTIYVKHNFKKVLEVPICFTEQKVVKNIYNKLNKI